MPIQYLGDRLIVNAVARPGGRVRVGLFDADGQPIAGRRLEDCQPLSRDELDWTVAWADGTDVGSWSGQPVRLQIELVDADLFGFQFCAASR